MAGGFPSRIRSLPKFEGPFDAHRLAAAGCEVLFASYPAGTVIEPHTHDSENVGVITSGQRVLGTENGRTAGRTRRVVSPGTECHWAWFEVDTSEIEFWFPPEPIE
jgi:hypothetical protein